MKTVRASFEIVTPMFLGGSEPKQPEGLRPSSIKGALRFWWRALNWSRMTGADDLEKLRRLHAEESRLFGVSARENTGGQGVFLLQVTSEILKADKPFAQGFDNGILYLLGQGLGKASKEGNQCERSAIPAKKKFELKLLFRPASSTQDVQSITEALQAFGLLGALGSRARHGMGSIAMTAMNGNGLDMPAWHAPTTRSEYKQQLQQLLAPAQCAQGLPPLSAFSRQSRIDMSCEHNEMMRLLALLGQEQQAYRSYGKDNRVNGVKAERNFKDDHHMMLDSLNGGTSSVSPERVVFGLPHNYFFSSFFQQKVEDLKRNGMDDKSAKQIARKQASAKVDFFTKEEQRRASPLLLHIHKVGDMYVAMHTFLTAQFLPQGSQLRIKAGMHPPFQTAVEVDWNHIHRYLDRFKTEHPTTWSTL